MHGPSVTQIPLSVTISVFLHDIEQITIILSLIQVLVSHIMLHSSAPGLLFACIIMNTYFMGTYIKIYVKMNILRI